MTTPERYEEWLDFYFGRTGDRHAAWSLYWGFSAPPALCADLFAATLDRSGSDLDAFTDGEVAVGLDALLFGNLGDMPHKLFGTGVTEPQRLAILRSFLPLYRDCLARRSPPVLGHLDEGKGHPLEYPTYMLWDVTPFDAMARKDEARTDVLLGVLDAALRLPNAACVESALHGLGHWSGPTRPRAVATIDGWLASRPEVRPELFHYARAARTGCIR